MSFLALNFENTALRSKYLTFYLLVDRVTAMNKKPSIYQKLLDVAETLIQTKGYNAFSYKDISNLVGIKTSSIHYYFPTKADLGKTIINRHINSLCAELEQMSQDKNLSYQKKLQRFIDYVVSNTYLANKKMCLGGMLASDVLTLPKMIQKEVQIFFNRLEDGLEELLIESLKTNELKLAKKEIRNEVLLILSLIEGALLLARLFEDEEHLAVIRKYIMVRFG